MELRQTRVNGAPLTVLKQDKRAIFAAAAHAQRAADFLHELQDVPEEANEEVAA